MNTVNNSFSDEMSSPDQMKKVSGGQDGAAGQRGYMPCIFRRS